jgi:hypothetical protein
LQFYIIATNVYYNVLEFTKAQRLDLAQKAWEKAECSKRSVQHIAKVHDVNPKTLRKRVNRVTKSKVEASHAMQRLLAREEESLVS